MTSWHREFVLPLVILSGAAYALGSIPFGLLIGRAFFHVDIRKSGSGNIGTANALRTFGKAGAAVVLVLDLLKGYVPTAVGLWVMLKPASSQIAFPLCLAGAAILGHCFSPWLGFRGGKGVATAVGAICALSPAAGIGCMIAWIITALVTRYSSVASMVSIATSPFLLWNETKNVAATVFAALVALFIVWTHRENLGRLRAGRENRLSFGGSAHD
jgi:glycerol-3-phosphate acyltransferase PlsY